MMKVFVRSYGTRGLLFALVAASIFSSFLTNIHVSLCNNPPSNMMMPVSTLSTNNQSKPQGDDVTETEKETLVQLDPRRQTLGRCALLFFGLPRSPELTLPSIKKNLLVPNADCDVYVHYYRKGYEEAGRHNDGGKLDADSILTLVRDLWDVRRSSSLFVNSNSKTADEPVIAMEYDLDESFAAVHNHTLHKIYTTRNSDGNLTYLPVFDDTFTVQGLVNVVKQWHSIESVWSLMERKASELGVEYARIGMFRSDVVFLTPIDIWSSIDANTSDYLENYYSVISARGPWMNDRMIHGPYNAVKIWATKRFDTVFKNQDCMHPELFLNKRIKPMMESDNKTKIVKRLDICFLRVRAQNMVMTADCFPQLNYTETPHIIEAAFGRNCTVQPNYFYAKC